MDALLASGERDAVVETLFRELESMSEEDLSALRSVPPGPDASQPPPRSLASCVLNEARLDPEQAAKITVPVLLLTGENSQTHPKRRSRRWQPRCPTPGSKYSRARSTSRTSLSLRLFRAHHGILARELMPSPN